MSKYIDADLYTEMQIYDEQYEEWSMWSGTIKEVLDQYTEEGCPPPIEVSESAISREYLEEQLQQIEDITAMAHIDLGEDPYDETEEITMPISTVRKIFKNAPSVVPKRSCYRCGLREDCEDSTERKSKEGEWIKEYNGNGWNDYWDYTCPNCGKKYERADSVLYDSFFCPNCGKKMKG